MNKNKIKEIIYIVLIILLAISTVVLSVLVHNKNDYFNKKCKMFELENVNFSHDQIVFIGDSLTDGCALDYFYQDLPLATYNRGIGGDNTAGVLKRLKVSLFDIRPSKIVLMIGVNDINGNVSNDTILKNYRNILNEISINLPNAEVFCVSILPINTDIEKYSQIKANESNARIVEINSEIEIVVDQFNYEFVNLHPHFTDSEGFLIKSLSPDGIHLNGDGYKIYSNLLKPQLI